MSEQGGRVIRIPSERGQLLLVEGGRTGRGRRSDSGGNLVAMSALTPHQLFPEAAADVVQLPDAVQPHTVRAYLQAAGVVDGPVIVYLTGRLMIDRRRRELHLGLRDSTPNSVRYDGLPWSWVVELLGARPAENTLVICDLTAGRESWDAARERAHELCRGLPLWGVLNPPDVKGPPSPFTRALVTALTHGFPELPDPVPAEEIHPLLAERAQLAPDTVEFAPSSGSLALANCSPESRPPSLRTAVRRLKAVSPRGGPSGTGVSALSAVPPNGMTPAQRAGLRGSGVVGGGALPDPRGESSAEDPGMGRRALGLVRAALAHSPDDEPEVPGTSRRDAARARARANTDANATSNATANNGTGTGTGTPNTGTTNGKPSRGSNPAPAAAKAEAAFGAGSGARADTGSSRAPLSTPGRSFAPHPAATRRLRRPTKAAMLAQEPEFPGPTGNPQPKGDRREPSPSSRARPDPPPMPRISVRIQTDAGALTPARRPPEAGPTQLPAALVARPRIGPGAPISMSVHGRAPAVGPAPARRALAQGATAAGALVRPVDVLPTYWNELAAIRHAADTGRGMEAWEKAAQLSMRMENLVGPDHPGTLDAQAMLAFVGAGLGRIADAVLIYCRVAERGATSVGPHHPSTIAAADNALKVWLRVADARESVRLGPTVVAMRQRVPGPGDRGLESARAHLERMREIVDPAGHLQPRPGTPVEPRIETRPEPRPETERSPTPVRGAPVRRRHAKA